MHIEPEYVQKFRGTRFSVVIYIDVCIVCGFVVVGCQIYNVRNYAIIRVFCLLNVNYLYVTFNDLHQFVEQW